MWLTDLFIKRPTLVTVFLALVLAGGNDFGQRAGEAAVSQLRRADDSDFVNVSGRFDDRNSRRDRSADRRSDRRRAGSAGDRDGDSARASHDRRAIRADVGPELRSGAIQGRVQNATRQLPSDLQTPTDHDLRSEPSRRRVAYGEIRDARARASFPRWLPIRSFPRSNRSRAFRSSR